MRGLFFVQAEDGIRDLVRSRGLGDVYKRQVPYYSIIRIIPMAQLDTAREERYVYYIFYLGGITVSYTHLTLPTSDLV